MSPATTMLQMYAELPTQPFTRQHLRERGIPTWTLESALDAGAVRRVLRGVYVRTDLRDSIALRCRAAALVISPHSVVRDRTAAWLHGVDVLELHEKEVLPPLETSVLRWHQPTRRRDHVGGTRDLGSRDIQQLHGLLVTTPLRTALDLGCCLSARDGLAALDAFMGAFDLTRGQLETEVRRYRRRRGVVQLRRLIAIADGRAESPGESWMRYDLLDAGLPAPALQHWVDIDGVATYRLDLAYPLHRIAVEYDGEEFHSTAAQTAYDEMRRQWLRDHGWTVVVVGRQSFTRAESRAWTDQVRQALAARAA